MYEAFERDVPKGGNQLFDKWICKEELKLLNMIVIIIVNNFFNNSLIKFLKVVKVFYISLVLLNILACEKYWITLRCYQLLNNY